MNMGMNVQDFGVIGGAQFSPDFLESMSETGSSCQTNARGARSNQPVVFPVANCAGALPKPDGQAPKTQTVNEDGSPATVVFDADGKTVVSKIRYRLDGTKELMTDYFQDGTRRSDCLYDSRGVIQLRFEYHADGVTPKLQERFRDGVKESSSILADDGATVTMVTRYREDGTMKSTHEYSSDGSSVATQFSSIGIRSAIFAHDLLGRTACTWLFDDCGKMTSEHTYGQDGFTTVVLFDGNGHATSSRKIQTKRYI